MSLLTEPADHPRACGENPAMSMRLSSEPGSPPRMRGKPFTSFPAVLSERITPAHAGKTLLLSIPNISDTDHPRACGENPHGNGVNVWGGGSPPRMRGKHISTSDDLFVRRITPAHAGKTLPRSSAAFSRSDHPRACGENSVSAIHASPVRGSPPRMRGKQWHLGRDVGE